MDTNAWGTSVSEQELQRPKTSIFGHRNLLIPNNTASAQSVKRGKACSTESSGTCGLRGR
jgi:hypothetical protein